MFARVRNGTVQHPVGLVAGTQQFELDQTGKRTGVRGGQKLPPAARNVARASAIGMLRQPFAQGL